MPEARHAVGTRLRSEHAPPNVEIVHGRLSHLILTSSMLAGLVAFLAAAPRITCVSYVNLPVLWLVTLATLAIFPTDADLASRSGRQFLRVLCTSVMVGFARQAWSQWPESQESENYTNPWSMTLHQWMLVLLCLNFAAFCTSSEGYRPFFRYGIRHGVLIVLSVCCYQLLERGTLAPPFIETVRYMSGRPTFSMALARGFNSLVRRALAECLTQRSPY